MLLPNNWRRVKLSEVGKFESGGTPSKNQPTYWDGNIPFVTGADITELYISSKNARTFLTEEGLYSGKTAICKPGTVLFVTRTRLGRAGVAKEIMGASQDLSPYTCGQELIPEYVVRYLHTISSYLIEKGRGSTILGLTRDFVQSLTIPLPPIAEQRRIAAILDRADAVRRKRQHAIALTEELLRSAFLEMFGDLEKHGWEISTVECIASSQAGSIRTGPFGSQLLHGEFVDEGIAVLGIDNAVQNQFRWAKPRFITVEKYKQLQRYTVYPKDVLITIMGTCGRCAIVPDDCPTAINTKHLCCITLNHEKCLPEFLHSYFLMHPYAKRYLEKTVKGAIMDGLNMSIIKKMPVPIVPLELQKKYARLCSQLIQTKQKTVNIREEGNDLFNSLLQKAFRGEL